jgi:hypothetical protein
MFWHKKLLALVLILILGRTGGCRSNSAHPTASASSRQGASSSGTSSLTGTPPNPPAPFSKRVPRDSPLATYNNPDFGISFRYPRHYALEEELEPEDSPLAISQQELDEAHPGATLLANVLIPSDAYPNTTFVSGSLQLAATSHLTQEGCQSFATLPAANWTGNTGTLTIHDVVFHWKENASTEEGTKSLERDYAGYSNGICYEFFLKAAVTSAADPEARIAQSDPTKIILHLQKFVSTSQFQAPAIARPAPTPPQTPTAQ